MGLKDLKRKLFNIVDDLKDHPAYRGESRKISLNDLSKEMNFTVPERYRDVADDLQNIVFRPDDVKKGDVCIIVRPAEITNIPGYTSMDQYDLAVGRGALAVIMPKETGESAGLSEKDHSVILVENGMTVVSRLIRSLRRRQKGKVVMITGSIGKTTTKEFCYHVSSSRFSTYRNINNTNTVFRVLKHLFDERNSSYEVFIHEIGAGFRGSLRYISKYYCPDILVITNVLKHHLSIYKTFEKLFDDKTCADEFMPSDGTVIVNYDDKGLREHKFIHRVVSFGIESEDVDYRGINIEQKDNILSFDVYERKTGTSQHVEIEIFGEHNVYNALAAFALGKTLGLTDKEMAESFRGYRTSGIRQMVVNIGGVNIDMDCYNVAEESIMSMLKMGEKFELDSDGEKIAVIGGENKLGVNARERSVTFGKELSGIKLDRFLFCGRDGDDADTLNIYGDGKGIYESFRENCDTPSEYVNSIDSLSEYLRKNVKRGDFVMLKGIFLLDMPISVDKAFGTSFSFSQTNNIEKMETVKVKGYNYRTFPGLDQAEISWAHIEEGLLRIPSDLEGCPVFRIKANAFRGWKRINRIVVEPGLRNIGYKALAGLPDLKELELPGTVNVLEGSCFQACTGLETVRLNEGVAHLSEACFRNCASLKKVYIPESVGMIEDDVFAGCPDVTIVTPRGSFAQEYALENGIKFENA